MLRLQGAHPYSGHPSGWWRPGLGQIPAAGNFLGPTAFYNAAPTNAYFAAPSGRPLMTPEITSPQPEHMARTFHCYVKNGAYTTAPFSQRDAMKASGWEETNYANCAGMVPMGTKGPGPALVGRQMGQVAVESPVSSFLFPVGLAGAAALALVLLLLVD
jgi:hypothetical protein